MTRILASVIVGATVLASCGVGSEVPEDADPIGVFVEGPCPMPIPEGLVEGESVRCGTIEVPELHAEPSGRTLLLRAAVFPSIGDDPSPAPLFVATAGPGASALETVTPEVAGPLGPVLLSQRDLVLIEYRGLPLAEPNLMCPEMVEFAAGARDRDLSGEQYVTEHVEAAAACRDRLREEGVRLEAFNNTETAADVALVMTALGYETFNVYGTSAGTILAQTLLRDHPDRLRSLVIDSTVPAGRGDVHIEAPTIAARTLDAVIGLCESDAPCAEAYPDLRREATDLIASYDNDPLVVEGAYDAVGEPSDLLLNGHRVAQALLMLNSQTPTVPLIPRFIHGLAERNEAIVENLLWTLEPPGRFSIGLGASIFCAEYSDFTEDDIQYPGLYADYERAIATQAFGARTLARTCNIWGVDTAGAALKQPVRSDVPVLLMAGPLDSLTPPAWAAEVASTLSNAYLFEVPGFAHSPIFGGECPAIMALEFLADPTRAPDGSCLESMAFEFIVEE